ncbi:MAG TPA: DUF2281 domain-containing protein [Longimicrobiaceae bacterium]|nr:DUF2281 domain-containing protein [Longimicrobiaceae bacterium]
MHDVLRQRLMRHIEALPEEQLYHALDYVEFLASKYARETARSPSSLQKFGELLEDKMRGQGLTIRTIRGTLGAVGTADRVFSGLAEAGRSLIREVEDGVKSVATPAPGGTGPQPGGPPALPRDTSGPRPAEGGGGPDHRNP